MNTYILIMTMIFSTYSGGNGGIESIENLSYAQCNKIGSQWVASIKERRAVGKGEAFYVCAEK